MWMQAGGTHTHLLYIHPPKSTIMRELIMDLTAAFFGVSLIILNAALLVAYACGNSFPLRFTMVVLTFAAVLALTNRVLAWTNPRR